MPAIVRVGFEERADLETTVWRKTNIVKPERSLNVRAAQ